MREAARALEHADVPIGAVAVLDGQQIGAGYNTRERDQDPCGHAEMHALRAAARRRGSWRLDGCTLYVTLEPCAMCAGAMVLARVSACVWAAPDPKGGFLGTLGNLGQDARLNHRFAVRGGVMEAEAAAMLRSFFQDLRRQRKASRKQQSPGRDG